MRFLVLLWLSVIGVGLSAGELTTEQLTTEQRNWLEMFEAGARLHANTDLPHREWLQSMADQAQMAGLESTAEYLRTAASGTPLEIETAFQKTLDAPVYVVLRFIDGKLADVLTSIPRPDIPHTMADSSPPAPNYSRAATLRLRAGKSASSAGPGSYLPFDRNLKTARTWIIYENSLRESWHGAQVRPLAEKLLPTLAEHVTADAHTRWYTLRMPSYDAGRYRTPEELDRFGTDKDALRILKADVLSTIAAGASDDDLATLLAVTLHTIGEVDAGKAPPPHRPASAVVLNYAKARGALRHDGTWTADLAAFRKALHELREEILAIEGNLDVARARDLFAKYGELGAVDTTIPKTTVTPRWVPVTKEAVVRSYLNSRTRESALAHLADDYRIRFGNDPGPGMTKSEAAEMLLWDYALHPVNDTEHFEVRDNHVIVRRQEMNDFAMLINFPGWNATSTYTVNDAGLIAEQHYVPTPDRPSWKPHLDRALPWLRQHRADVLARIYPNGRLKQDAEAAREWVAVLCDWRQATGQMLPGVCTR